MLLQSNENYGVKRALHGVHYQICDTTLISPKLQLLSGMPTEQSLAVYRALALSDVSDEYEAAMRHFPDSPGLSGKNLKD